MKPHLLNRTPLFFAVLAVAVLGLTAFTLLPGPSTPADMGELNIGDPAPMTDVEMEGISGESTTLAAEATDQGLLVMFTCNTCPYVLAWEDRFPAIAEQADELGIGFVALNPNEAQRSGVDSMEEMKKRAEEGGYTFPYVIDTNHQLADAFGATRTPEMFLFDSDLKLVYHGAIDDNAQDPGAVESTYLFDAMEALAAGEEIPLAQTRSVGCTIKRAS